MREREITRMTPRGEKKEKATQRNRKDRKEERERESVCV